MEKNFAIYNEMRAAAERVFNEGINAPAGVYSLAELAKVGTTCKTAPDGVYFRKDYNADQLININFDGFECSYPARQAFALAYKFERLAKVGTKARAAFQRVEDHGEPVAVFTLDAVTVENLAACEDPRKGIRAQMQGVFCDIAAGLSCCSDGYALNVARLADAQVMNADTLNDDGVILSRAFAKAAKGCKVSIYKDGANLRAVASNGASCEAVAGRYPNYKAVFSHVDESRPVRLVKNAKDLKKAFAAVAKTAGGANVFLSGLNADNYITVSVNGENGEISRRIALAAPLTFNFVVCCKAENVKCINNLSDTLYINKIGQTVLTGSKTLSLLSACSFYDSDLTSVAAAAYQLASPGKYNLNIFAAFTVPAESIQTTEGKDNADTLDVAPVVSSDSIQTAESNDNADTLDVAPAVSSDSIQAAESNDNADTLDVAPVVPSDSIQTAESNDNADTLDVAPVVSSDSIQAAESNDNADTLDVAPVAPSDSIQTAESNDNADTLDVALRRVWLEWLKVAAVLLLAFVLRSVSTSDSNAAHSMNSRAAVVDVEPLQAVEILDTLDVAPAESIQTTEGKDNADTLDVAPVVSSDSIQAAESNDNADTLDVAPAVSSDSIQAAESNDNADTLDVAPVAPAKIPIL